MARDEVPSSAEIASRNRHYRGILLVVCYVMVLKLAEQLAASGRFPMSKHFGLVVGCAFLLLSACSGPRTVATFQAEKTTISIEQTVGTRSHNLYAVRVGPQTLLPLEGYTSVHIDSIWNQFPTGLVVISGATDACALRTTLVLVTRTDASTHVIGDCGEVYHVAQSDDGITIRQDDVHAPKIWTLKDGVLDGPIVPQAGKVKAAPVRTVTHPGEEAAGALVPPPVSHPVGDDVIPSPIGHPGPASSQHNEPSLF